MNETYQFLYFGHYDFTNQESGRKYTGWSLWFLPNFAVGLRADEYGIRPEKFSLMEDEFAALGGVDAFSKLLGRDVVVFFRVRGKSVRLSGIKAVEQ